MHRKQLCIAHRRAKRAARGLPSPWGEGKGEGDRDDRIAMTGIYSALRSIKTNFAGETPALPGSAFAAAAASFLLAVLFHDGAGGDFFIAHLSEQSILLRRPTTASGAKCWTLDPETHCELVIGHGCP